MTRRSRLLALLLVAAAGHAGGLVAQVAGLPVRNAGVGTGIGLAADVGFPNAAAGKGVAAGLTGAIGLGPLGITGTVATWNPKGPGESITSVGATGNLKIIGGPLIPVSVTLQAGAARFTEDRSAPGEPLEFRTWHVPVGVGLALTIPNPVFSIKPWVAPRLDVLRTTIEADTPAETNTTTDFGISGGVDLGFLNGLTIRAMYDRVSRGGGVNVSTISVGLGFKVGT
jgi:outer membrane protein with beta-barrel domain